MKFLRIFLCIAFIFAITACHGKKDDPYDYPDEDTTPEKGDVGDPCMKKGDCKEGLLCIGKKCVEPATDKDDSDDADNEVEDGDTDTDTNDDDTDTDTNTNDGDTDTNIPDEDKPDDSDTQPDNDADTPVYIPECGNGLRDPGEECDNGLENSDEPGIHGITCRTNCIFARCQDGIVDSGEKCDDGNASIGDYCSPDCSIILGYCGDGIKQINEECEKTIDPYCADDCMSKTGFCGDGSLNGNEICDNAEPDVGDGEGIGSYYCSGDCSSVIGSCGDEILQDNEKCDDGNRNGTYGYCNTTCSGMGTRCGDGIVQSGLEVCDDGNTLDGDYCSSDCKTSNGSCGDGIIQDFEACDKANNNQGKIYCSDDCMGYYGKCGDGITQRKNCLGFQNCVETPIDNADETCDNGDMANGNLYCEYGPFSGCKVCDRNCQQQNGIPRYCGDGVISTTAGEVCDPYKADDPNSPYCSENCKQIIGSCGDGKLNGNEACDPGLDPYCLSDCSRSEGYCGDNDVNGNEVCDNGENNGNTDCPYFSERTECTICTENCSNAPGTPRYCGNGLTEEGYENCDSGSNNGTYGNCKADCSGMGSRCGDGILQRGNCTGYDDCTQTEGANEQCDNGQNNGQTKCKYGDETCKVCNNSCIEVDGTPVGYCGDGVINRENCAGINNCVVTPGANESCDDAGHNGEYGYCRAGCYGKGERCGDGVKNGDEVCDDGGLNGEYGHCASDCMSEGRRCGDGVTETAYGEVCDDGPNNGKYRSEQPGYCNSDCAGRGEGGYCGDSVENGEETCDNGANNGQTKCPYGERSCDVCNSNCIKQPGITSYCGDGIKDTANGEKCDKGANNAAYNGLCDLECKGAPPRCGDSNIDEEFGEVCDDGANNGKYSSTPPGFCSFDCKVEGGGGYCGDGNINGYETCDSGPLNGEYGGNCNSNCTGYTHYCGDGILDDANGENCDDGDLNGTYGKCNPLCEVKIECGDGILQKGIGACGDIEGCVEMEGADEQCDNGPQNGTETDCVYGLDTCTLCSDLCTTFTGNTAFCGDGIIQNEDCTGLGDDCVQTTGAQEICDDSDDNGSYNHCNSDCDGYMAKCGDGFVNRENCEGYTNCIPTQGINEECDDGEDNGSYDHCNINCSGTIKCGDGDISNGEVCDDGLMNGTYNHCNDTCTKESTGFCGDGILQKEIGTCGTTAGCVELGNADEDCDAGSFNGLITDCEYGELNCGVCNTSCKIENGTPHFCGDGTVDTANGELCDDMVNDGTFGHCDALCKVLVNYQCGDGKIQKATAAQCGTIPLCDGSLTENCCEVVEFAQGDQPELCDDGILNNTPGYCNSRCNGRTSYCGDGIIQRASCVGFEAYYCIEDPYIVTDEACDDGGANGHYGFCNSSCTAMRDERCGDGIVQRSDCSGYASCVVVPGANEFCDEGDEDNGKYYNHCDSSCSNKTWAGYCGDGRVQMPSESECETWAALDPTNRKLCSTDPVEGCCEAVAFAPGDTVLEDCDNGREHNGYHGYCNKECSGQAYCGDDDIGEDEFCEPGSIPDGPFQCSVAPQFAGSSGTISLCDNSCMPDMAACTYDTSYVSPFFTTGQTLCYSNDGTITCPATEISNLSDFYGQDQDLQFPHTAHNFAPALNNAAIMDSASGLLWEKETPDRYGYIKEEVFHKECDMETSCTLEEAELFCANSSTGDIGKWRLPTAAEFSTIMDYASTTHIYSGFGDTTHGPYWTSDGIVFSTTDGTSYPSTGTAQVKCVNDNYPCQTLQCKNAASTKQYHFDNALMTTSGTTFVFWYFGNMESKTWENALYFCKNAGINGMNDMRLPTVNELMWLTDRKNGGSLIPGFAGKAWTSTTRNGFASEAYAVNFSNGSVVIESKEDTNKNIVICIE